MRSFQFSFLNLNGEIKSYDMKLYIVLTKFLVGIVENWKNIKLNSISFVTKILESKKYVSLFYMEALENLKEINKHHNVNTCA